LCSSPAYGPPATSPRRRRGGVVGPLILIFIGCVFLLQNTGYLPPNFWLNLWRLWPVILVLAGMELLLANRIPRFALTGLAAVILVGGAVAMNSGLGSPQTSAVVSRADQKELGGARQAAVTVRFDAGQLVVGPIERPSAEQLSTMAYTGPADQVPQARYAVSGDTGRLDYAPSERSGPSFTPFSGGQPNTPRMELYLNPLVPITSLSLKAGATDARLDLSSLRVSDIDMSVGAAATWVRVPEAAGRTTARISGGASTITLEVPQGVAAQIRVRGGLSSVKVDESRFPQVGDHFYRSANFETAQNRIDLNFETGVTSIQVS
jgi:hypothetical protein